MTLTMSDQNFQTVLWH